MGMAAAEQQYHILAVDDSFLDRKLIERILKTSSYQVTTVDSGYKALEFLGFQDDEAEEGNTNRPSVSPKSQMEQCVEVNLIITDYCMPGMTGYDLLKKLKESSSLRIRSIPVVIMSSEDVSSRITSCLDGGAEEFFIKPVRLSDVNKLRPYMLKAIHGVQKEQQNTEQDVNDTDLLKAEKQQESELLTEPHQEQQEQHPQKQESQLLTEPQQQQQQQSNKRKSIDEGLSPDRTRHRCSSLTVV